MVQLEDKILKQTSFLNLKWYVQFHFKENWIEYIIDDKQEKVEVFHWYESLYDYKNISYFKSHQLYYLLVWIIFWLIWFLSLNIIYILFFITFIFLYYRYYENFLKISYSFYIKNDSKSKEILKEIELRVKKYRKDSEYLIDEFNDKDYQKQKFDNLLKDEIITKEEFDSIIIELDNKFINIDKIDKYDILKKLLIKKWILNNFKIEKYTFENDYLPWWIESFSWLLIFDDWNKYNFWLNWDKNAINPETNDKWYYSLGDSKEIIEKYWRSFFKKNND